MNKESILIPLYILLFMIVTAGSVGIVTMSFTGNTTPKPAEPVVSIPDRSRDREDAPEDDDLIRERRPLRKGWHIDEKDPDEIPHDPRVLSQ